MKKNIFIILGLIVLLASTSCTSIKKTSTTTEVNTGIFQYPTVTDLEILPKVEKSVEWPSIPFNIGQPSLSVRKTNLVADLVKENGADILLEPQFKVELKIFGTNRLTVYGFPAKFKNFRKANTSDIEALKATCPSIYNIANPKLKNGKKK